MEIIFKFTEDEIKRGLKDKLNADLAGNPDYVSSVIGLNIDSEGKNKAIIWNDGSRFRTTVTSELQDEELIAEILKEVIDLDFYVPGARQETENEIVELIKATSRMNLHSINAILKSERVQERAFILVKIMQAISDAYVSEIESSVGCGKVTSFK